MHLIALFHIIEKNTHIVFLARLIENKILYYSITIVGIILTFKYYPKSKIETIVLKHNELSNNNRLFFIILSVLSILVPFVIVGIEHF